MLSPSPQTTLGNKYNFVCVVHLIPPHNNLGCSLRAGTDRDKLGYSNTQSHHREHCSNREHSRYRHAEDDIHGVELSNGGANTIAPGVHDTTPLRSGFPLPHVVILSTDHGSAIELHEDWPGIRDGSRITRNKYQSRR